MASRNPRARLGISSDGGGLCRPTTTRGQALRQAKSAAIINSRQEPPRPRRLRTGLAKVGPPPLEPKRLDFSKPGMTRSMMVRMQHAQKLKEAEEQKRRHEEVAASRRPRRTAAPLGGDIRSGREKSAKQWQPQSVNETGLRCPPRKMMQDDFQQPLRGQGRRGPGISGPSRLAGPSGAKRRQSIGSQMRTTVTDAANRSIQVIQETLDEQDVAECVVVQNKLQDLQNARRDFVMAIANVSGNAVSFADLDTSISLPGSPITYQSGPLPSESPPRNIYKIPDLDDPYLQINIDRHEANLASARQYLERREAQRRIDEEFARVAQNVDEDLRYDIPFEQDMEGETCFEDDEDEAYYNNADIDDIERFFDIANYPVIASSYNERRPLGREILHPDLVNLEDPWYRECLEDQDLMEFDLMEFSP